MRLLALLLWILAASGAPGASKQTLSHAGRSRAFYVHVPPGWTKGGRAPAVLALHGGGGSAESFEKVSPLLGASDPAGFIVAYPEGVDKSWGDGRPERPDVGDDVGFLDALRELLIRDFGADPKRVFATGISNGGGMSFRLACERADSYRGVAAVVMNLGEKISATCHPAKPISVLHIAGDGDKLVPAKGGEITGPLGLKKRGKVLSIEATLAFFTKANGCSGEPMQESWDRDSKDGTAVTHSTHSKCRGGVRVEQYFIKGGGHTWPMGSQYLPKLLVGPVSGELNASHEIIRFFLEVGK